MCKFVALVALLVFVLPSSPVAAADDAPKPTPSRVPRVRPNDSRSAALLLQGIQRSDTLREIVERLEQSDVIVYLVMQPSLKRSLAGTLTWVTGTKSFRYVRISLNPELSSDALISVIGHELQHALEVSDAPSIVDTASLQAYYEKNGLTTPSHANGWDTLAARVTGEEVRRELLESRAVRGAEFAQQFNPEEWHTLYRRARGLLTH